MRLPVWVTLCTITWSAVAGADKDPRVPPGRDPGGPAIALISTGINYTLPAIASRLARDGEGELVGRDFADGDNLPFDVSQGRSAEDHGGDGTSLASLIASHSAGARIVAVRIDPQDPTQLARALAFVAQTPARVIVLAMRSTRGEEWEPFRLAAQHFRQLLIVVPSVGGPAGFSSMVYPTALGLDNVLTADVLDDVGTGVATTGFDGSLTTVSEAMAAAASIAARAADMFARNPAIDGAGMRRLLQPR
jgi:hypothetical protein